MKNINLNKNFLTGTWKNDFISNKKRDSEICDIKADGRYFINGEHWFNVIDFKYDSDANKISFIKAAVQPGDDRKFYNTVLVIDNNYFHLNRGYGLGERLLNKLFKAFLLIIVSSY